MCHIFFYINILHSRCTRRKCFENVSEDLRRNLLNTFNSLATKNERDAFLSGLISFHAPTRRRPRRPNEQGESEGENSNDDLIVKQFANNTVFTYKVRISDLEVPVCFKAFVAISGITWARLRRIQGFLLQHGRPPTERRGIHKNRPNKLPEEVANLIIQHIQSFKPRQSHYSRRKNPHRLYLPETLSIKKCLKCFWRSTKLKLLTKHISQSLIVNLT